MKRFNKNKTDNTSTDLQWEALLENETEANKYAAKCLAVCAGVGVVGIFIIPDRPEFDIYAAMNQAKEVGGDFYDFFMVDETHLAIVIADVSEKGVPAALFMVTGKTRINDHTKPDTDLGKVFTEVNELLCKSNNEGLFITAFEGVLDLVTGEFCFVNAGHEMPFIAKSGAAYEARKIRAGFVLAGMEGVKYQSGY